MVFDVIFVWEVLEKTVLFEISEMVGSFLIVNLLIGRFFWVTSLIFGWVFVCGWWEYG